MTVSAITDWPKVYFRPEDIVEEAVSFVERYDEKSGSLVPDDGKPALAFSCRAGQLGQKGRACVLYMGVPFISNVIVRWEDEVLWHYQTRNGEPKAGEFYPDRVEHPNDIAAKITMDRTRGRFGYVELRAKSMMDGTPTGPCAWCARSAEHPGGLEPEGV